MGTQTSAGCLCTTLSSGASQDLSQWWLRWVPAIDVWRLLYHYERTGQQQHASMLSGTKAHEYWHKNTTKTQYKDKTSNKPLNAENITTCYLVLQWVMSQSNMLTHDDLIRAACVVTHPSLFTWITISRCLTVKKTWAEVLLFSKAPGSL